MSQRRKIPPEIIRQRALGKMALPTREVANDLEIGICKRNRRETMMQYDVGVLAQEIVADPTAFGADGLRQLATHLSLPGGEEELLEARRVALVFPRKFVREQCATLTPSGFLLEFGHLVALADIESEETRLEVLAQIQENNLSVAQTRRLVREMTE